jgi:amino acid transporter
MARQVAVPEAELHRAIRWYDAFWIASGVPALLVFSVGYIAILDGPVSVVIWIAAVLIGFGMAFVYAELAGMFPEKSGGPPVFGAQAWKRYFKPIAPLNIWGYWFAWSPVLAIGGLLMGSYVQREWASGQDWSVDWTPTTDFGIHLNFAYVVGAAVLIGLFWLNHFGIRESAITQLVLGVCSLVPLALLIVIPIFEGKIDLGNFSPFAVPGATGWHAFELIAAGLFVAAWSAYAFETPIVCTAEFRNPQRDAPKAVFSAGGLCLFFYGLGPFVLYGVVGGDKIKEDPATALVPLAQSVFGTAGELLIILLLVALLLSINTAILGSARTLYQASKDGWIFGFMQRTSIRGVPLRAMGFDVVFNLILMLIGNPIYIIAASTVGYMVFNVLNITTGYLLRKDAPLAERPYTAPLIMIRLGVVFAAVNFVLLFVGSPSWGWKYIGIGWAIVLAGIVIYYARAWNDRRVAAATVAAGARAR